MKNVIPIILFSLVLYGCMKSEDFQNMSCNDNPQTDIIGKWELVQIYIILLIPQNYLL